MTSVAGAVDPRGARLDRDVAGAVTAIGDAQEQDAAVAFLEDATWDIDTLSSTASPRAWWSEQGDPSQTLIVQTALVLLTAHPLVGNCDAAILTDRAIPASLKQD